MIRRTPFEERYTARQQMKGTQMTDSNHSENRHMTVLPEVQRRIDALERQLADERMNARALRNDCDRYRNLLDNAGEWIWELDAGFRCIYTNRRVQDVLGYLPEEILGRSPIDFMAPGQFKDNQDLLDSIRIASGAIHTREDQFIHKDGSIRFLETNMISNLDDGGTLIGFIGNCRDVTRRKLAEQTLQKSEERFQLVSQASNDAIYDWDIASETIWLSESHRAILGFPDKEGHYRWWRSRLHPADRERILGSVRSVMKGVASIWMDEYRFLCADGRYIDVIDRGQIIRDEKGSPVRIVGSMMDVTARKLAQEAVRKSEENYRKLIEDLPIGIVVRSPDGHALISNSIARRYAGVPEEETWNQLYQDGDLKYLREDGTVLPPEEYPSNLAIARNAAVSNLIYGVVHPDSGDVHWFLTSAQPQRDPDGKLVRIIVSLIDITARKKAEEALEESEAKYRFLTEGMSDIVWTMDKNLTYTYLSPSVELALGMTANETIRRGTENIMTKESLVAAKATVDRLLSLERQDPGGPARTATFEAAYYHCSGALVWLENIIRAVTDEQGEVIGIHGVSRNITEIRQAAIEREKLIVELKKALSEVKVLSGMLPICTSCKKIRDDKGYWNQIESYISEHSDALFSHSICPDCAEKLYPYYKPKKDR